MNDEVLAEYVLQVKKKRDLEAELKQVKAWLKDMEGEVTSYFQQSSTQSINRDGITIFLRRELWAGREDGVSPEQAVQCLIDADLGEFAAPKVNTTSLSAYLRELDRDGRKMPSQLEGIIKLVESFKIGARSS